MHSNMSAAEVGLVVLVGFGLDSTDVGRPVGHPAPWFLSASGRSEVDPRLFSQRL